MQSTETTIAVYEALATSAERLAQTEVTYTWQASFYRNAAESLTGMAELAERAEARAAEMAEWAARF